MKLMLGFLTATEGHISYELMEQNGLFAKMARRNML